jgi:hypothetical protein
VCSVRAANEKSDRLRSRVSAQGVKMTLRCTNKGCGKMYDEATNTDGEQKGAGAAEIVRERLVLRISDLSVPSPHLSPTDGCKYHPGAPLFHEGLKVWLSARV